VDADHPFSNPRNRCSGMTAAIGLINPLALLKIHSTAGSTWRCMPMMKSGLACCVLTMAVLVTQAAQNQPNTEKDNPVTLKYLGTAGWEITDGTTIILADPYLSRINGPAPPGGGSGHSIAGDTRRAYGWGDLQDQGAPGGNSPSGAQIPNRFAGSTLGWSSAPSSSVSWGLHLPSSTPPRVMCLTERHTQI